MTLLPILRNRAAASRSTWAIVFTALSATDSHLLRPRVGEHPPPTLELASRAQRELDGRVRGWRRLLRPRPVLLVAEVHARVLVAQPGPVLLQPFGRRLAQVGDEDQRAALVPLVAAHRAVVDAAVAVVRHPAFALGAVGERRPFTGFGAGLIERRERHPGVPAVGPGASWGSGRTGAGAVASSRSAWCSRSRPCRSSDAPLDLVAALRPRPCASERHNGLCAFTASAWLGQPCTVTPSNQPGVPAKSRALQVAASQCQILIRSTVIRGSPQVRVGSQGEA